MHRILILLSILLTAYLWGTAQNVSVSGALVGNGSYPTLTDAFAAINGGAQTGAQIDIGILLDTYEGTGSATLNAGTWTRITIAPVGAPRTISGATTFGQALIHLNGADRVLFDGLLAGQKALTIVNTTVTSIAGSATVRLDNAAQYNRIHDCVLLGSSVTTLGNEGGTVLFASTTTTGGNSYNCLRRCEIGPAPGGLPTYGVFSSGSVSVFNVVDSLVDCRVYDYFDATNESGGLRVKGGNINWRVLGNRFYQTAPRTKSFGSSHADIWIGGTVENQDHVVSGNFLGGTDSLGGGMATYNLASGAGYFPLMLFTGSTYIGANHATFNTITHIQVNAFSTSGSHVPFAAARIGGRVNFHHNVIGSDTAPGAIDVNLLSGGSANINLVQCTGFVSCYLADNVIGGAEISTTGLGNIAFFGINGYDFFGEYAAIMRNQIGFAAAPITVSAGGSATQITGIRTYSDDITVNNNTIAYIQCDAPMSGAASWDSFTGIRVASQFYYSSHVLDNHVHSLTSTHPSANVKMLGIIAGNVFQFSRNFVHSLETESPNSQITGIAFEDGGIYVTNNMIQLGIDTAGNSLTEGQTLIGLRNECCSTFVVHNSVYIGGHNVNGSGNTYAMSEQPIITGVGQRKYYNNIFFNTRSNGLGTGQHYAIAAANSASTLLLSDGNLLAAHGAGGVVGRFMGVDYLSLALWQTAFGQDLNSISADPNFIQPSAPASAVDLHIVAPPLLTPIEGTGQSTLSSNIDFDSEQRHLLSPVDIGADAGAHALLLMPNTPAAVLRGNGSRIMSGDSTPDVADFTNFISASCTASPLGVFVIVNEGLTPLTVGNFSITGSAAFVLTPPSQTTLTTGQATSIAVTFNPVLNVPAQATVSFTTNDPNMSSYSFQIMGHLIPDTTDPTALCQSATVQLNAAGQAQFNPALLDGGSTDNCAIDSLWTSPGQLTCAQLGTQSVQLSVADAAGNAATCNGMVTVVDALAPQAVCQAITLPLSANGSAQLVAAAIDGGSTDNCGIDSLWTSLGQLSCAQLGPNAVQLHVRDASGNIGTCTATVTVTDALPPTALCQPTTLQLNSAGQAQLPGALLDGGSTDNCGITTRLASQTQFTCADVGVRPVTLTVGDGSGNVATCSTQVTVLDPVAPVLTCANLTVTLPSSGPATITPAMVGTATDACGIASYQLSQTQVACPNVGSSPLRLIAEDVHGNRDTCLVVLITVTAPLAVLLTPATTTPCGYNLTCAGQTNGSATASVSGSCAPYTYAWSNGQAGATATGLGAGAHSVTVTSASGQQQVQPVILTAPLPLAASISTTRSCVSSNSGTVTASGTGGNSCQAYSYLWSNGATSASLSGLAPGTYQLTITDSEGCTATSSATILTWPAVSVAVTQNLGTLVATPGLTAYQWYNSVGAIPGATAAQFTPLVSGSYHVVATDSNGCSWTSAAFPFVYVGAAQALPGAWDITLHPNPNTGRFQVLLPMPLQGPVTVKVTDLRGRSVYTETLDLLSSDHIFDLSAVAAGTYLVTIQSQEGLLPRLRFVRE